MAKNNANNLSIRKNELLRAIEKVHFENLAQVKELISKIFFCDILTENMSILNKGSLIHIDINDKQHIVSGAKVQYYIENIRIDNGRVLECGVALAVGNLEEYAGVEDGLKFSADKENNGYARFIADLLSEKIIFLPSNERFYKVEGKEVIPVTDEYFSIKYESYVNVKEIIPGLLPFFVTLMKETAIRFDSYEVKMECIAGKDWIYDLVKLELFRKSLSNDELVANYFDISLSDINDLMVKTLIDLVAYNKNSKNNLLLLPAYIMLRKHDLLPPEKYFIFKDFGRTGKGLILHILESIFTVKNVDLDALSASGFEASNAWMNLSGADVCHANESGKITAKQSRPLRKIATNERVRGRRIGTDNVDISLNSVLIIDTNEQVDIPDLAANNSRKVAIRLKDRPKNETDNERHVIFAPFWEHFYPNGKANVAAGVSLLLYSLNYLKEKGGRFDFFDVIFQDIYDVSQLNGLQIYVVDQLKKGEVVVPGDLELLKKEECNNNNKLYSSKLKDIGVAFKTEHNKKTKMKERVAVIVDRDSFNYVCQLLE